MGRTLQRERKKAAAAAAAAPPVAVAPLKLTRASATRRVSAALDARRWDAALEALGVVRSSGLAPRLGAVQRWVRAADCCGDAGLAARLLAAIVRAADAEADPAAPPPPVSATEPPGTLRRFPDWTPPAPPPPGAPEPAPPAVWPCFWPLALEAGAAPPAGPPPRIFGADGAAAPLAARPPGAGVARHDVPAVPGAFAVAGALSPAECAALVALAEALGFREDADYASGALSAGAGAPSAARGAAAAVARPAGPGGERAAGVALMADAESLLAPLFARLAPLLPPALGVAAGGGALAGLNPRFRFYRYAAGGVYRPHVDGAWPESAVRGGAVVHDAHGGARWSRLTLVLYLNDDFEGGTTTFFAAAPDAAGVLEARGVRPARGAALLFPHGGAAGSLVHEGSAVARGVKYIVRTDVVYERAAAPARGRAAAA
jgi:hypothetical protein